MNCFCLNNKAPPVQTEIIADSLHDSPSTPQEEEGGFKINKVLATPSVRKMAMENKAIILDSKKIIF